MIDGRRPANRDPNAIARGKGQTTVICFQFSKAQGRAVNLSTAIGPDENLISAKALLFWRKADSNHKSIGRRTLCKVVFCIWIL
jgi:hypothetical protein